MILKAKKAFERLKTIFVNAFILKHYDWNANLCMKINASNYKVEDMLNQKNVRIVSKWYNQWRSELIVLDL